jgi:hypothetical protein
MKPIPCKDCLTYICCKNQLFNTVVTSAGPFNLSHHLNQAYAISLQKKCTAICTYIAGQLVFNGPLTYEQTVTIALKKAFNITDEEIVMRI